jgi:hypothetical protein
VAFAAAPRLADLPYLQQKLAFQQKLATLGRDNPGQRALCRLLGSLVAGYIEAFDKEPLPVAVADCAYQRLLDLVASLDFRASADHRLADLDRVAACDLSWVCSGPIETIGPICTGIRSS